MAFDFKADCLEIITQLHRKLFGLLQVRRRAGDQVFDTAGRTVEFIGSLLVGFNGLRFDAHRKVTVSELRQRSRQGRRDEIALFGDLAVALFRHFPGLFAQAVRDLCIDVDERCLDNVDEAISE